MKKVREQCSPGKIMSPKKRCIQEKGKTAKKYDLYVKPLPSVKRPHKNWREITSVFDFRWTIYDLTASVRTIDAYDQQELEHLLLKWLDKKIKYAISHDETMEDVFKQAFGWNDAKAAHAFSFLQKNPVMNDAWSQMQMINPENMYFQQGFDSIEWKDAKTDIEFDAAWYQFSFSLETERLYEDTSGDRVDISEPLYDSMTLEELKEAASARGITGFSKKKNLIRALKNYTKPEQPLGDEPVLGWFLAMNKYFANLRSYYFYARIANPPYVLDTDILRLMYPSLDTSDINDIVTLMTNISHDLIQKFLNEQDDFTIVIKGQTFIEEGYQTSFKQIIFSDAILYPVLWQH
jgi:hypothetical protein